MYLLWGTVQSAQWYGGSRSRKHLLPKTKRSDEAKQCGDKMGPPSIRTSISRLERAIEIVPISLQANLVMEKLMTMGAYWWIYTYTELNG